MKKYLILLAIFFSFLFMPNVLAADKGPISSLTLSSDTIDNVMLSDYSFVSSSNRVNLDVLQHFESSLASQIDTTIYDYYITFTYYVNSSGDPGFTVVYWEKSQTPNIYLDFTYSSSNDCVWVSIKTTSAINWGAIVYNLSSSNSSYTFTTNTYYGNSVLSRGFTQIYKSNGSYILSPVAKGNVSENRLYKTTYNFKYSSLSNPWYNYITNFYISDNGENHLISYQDVFFNTDLEMPFLTPPSPVLSFSSNVHYDTFNNVSSVDLDLIVDNYYSGYHYQFQLNGTSGTWTNMLLEYNSVEDNYYFSWSFDENVVVYVRVINSNNNLITSATFTIDNIYNYVDVSSVIDLGSNNYGYFSNYVLVQNVKSTTENNLVSILCEENRPFDNGYCSLKYSDLINNHSNISYFNDTTLAFHTLFGNANNVLVSNKYYAFSFRILKPFVPDVSGLVISTNNGDYNLSNYISNVFLNDGGSYTDYVVLFDTSNFSFDSSYNLNSISVYFSLPLSNYYSTIPESFSFSVYRSFKLSYYDSFPSSDIINDLFFTNNLSYIDGTNSQLSFFTDTNFNTYGFSGIITAPFRLIYALENYDTCTDIVVPFPHSNQTFTLKCVRSSIPSSLNPLISILQIVLSGIICYRIAVGTLSIIKQVVNPEDANIEVVDL